MMLLLALAAAAIQPATDEPKIRTGFMCDVWKKPAEGSSTIVTSRHFAILLDGAGPFEPLETRDPQRVLEGAAIQRFLITKPDGSLMAGLTGELRSPTTWLLSFTPGKTGAVPGFNVGLGRNGHIELYGFCLAVQSKMTIASLEASADKWNAKK